MRFTVARFPALVFTPVLCAHQAPRLMVAASPADNSAKEYSSVPPDTTSLPAVKTVAGAAFGFAISRTGC